MSGERRFACTQCGACCNRPPEVELGEAAALADTFAWQMLFRLYSLPKAASGGNATEFFESKRLLTRFAAYSYDGKALVDGRKQARTFHLTISALALDLQSGTCPAISGGRCTIYPRRPLSCRSVPLHYSRPEAAVTGDLDAFVATPAHACDSGGTAPVVVQDGRIVAADIVAARSAADVQAAADKPWKAVLLKAMKAGHPGLPSLAQVEQNAAYGALTVPMAVGWRVALESNLIDPALYQSLLAAQVEVLDRMAREPSPPLAVRQAIAELRRANSITA